MSSSMYYDQMLEEGEYVTSVMKVVYTKLYEINRYLQNAYYRIINRKFKARWVEIQSPEVKENIEENISPEIEVITGFTGKFEIYEEDLESENIILEEFSSANQIYTHEDCTYQYRIKVLEFDPKKLILTLEEKPPTQMIYTRQSTYQVGRQMSAVKTLQDSPRPHHRPLIRLLQYKDKTPWPKFEIKTITDWFLLTEVERPGTKSQRVFVQKAISSPDFAILEGPPGTGKTTAICELILQAISDKKKILLCASTHVAVDNVLEKLQEFGYLENEVIAVRIGDAKQVSEEVKHVQFENRKRIDRENIIDFLSSIGDKERVDSQQHLLDSLTSEEGESVITNIILESANLVCGTTLGILQHPEIQQSRADAPPLFDYLIIDEASKTTFQEFLVPALFAKKWILAGDPKQLSPYVDTLHLESNIDTLLQTKDQAVCFNVFKASKGHNQLIELNDKKFIESYLQQSKEIGIEATVAVLDDDDDSGYIPKQLEIFGSNLFLVNQEGYNKIKKFLPMDVCMNSKSLVASDHRNKHEYWLHHFSHGIEKTWENRWAQEISWRLVRYFEKRNVEEDRQFYLRDIENLLPKWELFTTKVMRLVRDKTILESKLSKLKEELDRIRIIALPSILELLYEGFEKKEGVRRHNVLTDGFDKSDSNIRHELLEYQHRMHPEISLFPRNHIYLEASLIDPDYMVQDRVWRYSRYQKRCIWLDAYKGLTDREGNFNQGEIDILMDELRKFRDWAKNNPRKDPVSNKQKPWEIAVLTFYKPQEFLLRMKMREFFNVDIGFVNFSKKEWNIKLKVCTVDRFQGHEADIVFLSFVQSNRNGFLDSLNRLNVALTRAKYQLVLIGKRGYFSSQIKSKLLQKLANEVPYEMKFGGQ